MMLSSPRVRLIACWGYRLATTARLIALGLLESGRPGCGPGAAWRPGSRRPLRGTRPDGRRRAGRRGPAAPIWIGLDRQAYAAQLVELRQWADAVLRRQYGGYELRDCWPSHIHAIWELSTLAAEWHQVYGGGRPDLAAPWSSTTAGSPAPCAASPASPGHTCRNASRAAVPGKRAAN